MEEFAGREQTQLLVLFSLLLVVMVVCVRVTLDHGLLTPDISLCSQAGMELGLSCLRFSSSG